MAESLDLTRESARVESFGSYVVVSCLTATASFNTIQQLALEDPNPANDILILRMSGLVIVALSTLAGIYSTVVFSLCAGYGRTSLGLRRDNYYDNFIADTQSLRGKAFKAYMLSLGLFLLELSLLTTERLIPTLRYPFLISFSILAILALRDWNEIVKLATPIFCPCEEEDRRPSDERFQTSNLCK